jgi:hypothetical protein
MFTAAKRSVKVVPRDWPGEVIQWPRMKGAEPQEEWILREPPGRE